MVKMQEPMYKVRPSSRASPQDTFRIFLSAAQLSSHKFQAGDTCHIVTSQGLTRPALVWPAYEKIRDDVVQTSKALQDLYNLKLDCRIYIRHCEVASIEAYEITVCENLQNKSEAAVPNLHKHEWSHWAWLVKHFLGKTDVLTPGMILDGVKANDEQRSFQIQSVNSSTDPALYRLSPSCVVRLNDGHAESANNFEHGKNLNVPSEGIGGLDKQIKRMNQEMIKYNDSHQSFQDFPFFYRSWRGGILLHGVRGTGKSKILSNICNAGWRKVFHIKNTVKSQRFGEIETTIHQIFSEALSCQPSVIIIDCLESIAGTKTDLAVNVGPILCQELDRLDRTQTLAVGATRSLTDIDQDLRHEGRFDLEIEIPIPGSHSRAEILKALCALPKDKAHSTLDRVAARAHGFVGADLSYLLIQAVRISQAQDTASESMTRHSDCRPTEPIALLESMEDAFNGAMRAMQPTAMYGIREEIPETKWSDIGGQDWAKKRIEQAVAWPIKFPDKMTRIGIPPKKGLLLYGPPGCSKTMIARAAATESGLNFIAVKGAEMLNMYVGETERAVREMFRRARAASPSIIFFDEIDAVGAARDDSQQGGVHTVTTLLNELDGFAEEKGVFVLAATNKPEVLDPALIREGRFSQTMYIGLPELDDRRDILRIQKHRMAFSDEIDLTELAELTKGFTGAEIVGICQKAGYAALEEELETGEEQRIHRGHMDLALLQFVKSVTPEMEEKFKAWEKERR